MFLMINSCFHIFLADFVQEIYGIVVHFYSIVFFFFNLPTVRILHC